MNVCAVSIQSSPVLTVYTAKTILKHKENYKPLFVGRRSRYATCTGAAWFHENYLAILNYYGRKLNTYLFNSDKNHLEPLQEIVDTPQIPLISPENLSVSPDGSILAICTCPPDAGLKLYNIDLKTHLIDPESIFSLKANRLLHNIKFTPDGRFLATTGWDTELAVCIYEVLRDDKNVSLKRVFTQKNQTTNLAAKAIAFTKDAQFVVVAYSPHVGKQIEELADGELFVYKFDSTNGTFGDVVSCLDPKTADFFAEDIAFIDNNHMLIASDQENDRLLMYPFDPVTGQIGQKYTCIQEPEGRLNFPHGIAVKKDESYVVVTNYGDDKFNVYRVQ